MMIMNASSVALAQRFAFSNFDAKSSSSSLKTRRRAASVSTSAANKNREGKFNSRFPVVRALLFGGRGGSGGLKKTPEQKNKLKRLEKLNGDPRYEGEEFWPEDLKQMRTPIMAGNWKCNPKTLDEARTLASLVAANTMEDRRENDNYFTTNNNTARGGKRNGFNLFNAKMNRRGENNKNVEVLICPPAAFLSEVSQLVRFLYKKNIIVYVFNRFLSRRVFFPLLLERGTTNVVITNQARVKRLIPLLRIEAGSNYLLLLKRYLLCHSYSDSLV